MEDSERVMKWRMKNVKRYEFYVHKENEKDVYEKLEKVASRRQYILELIKKDIEKDTNE